MQGYSYSIFSLAAIAIHLIINFNFLLGRGIVSERGRRYRGFLFGILFYYLADGAWGILAGLDWTRLLYADTILFFFSLPVFVFMWCRFVTAYLEFGKRTSQFLSWSGYALLAFNIVMLTANFFNGCFFSFDENGKYLFGDKRYLAFALLIAFIILIAGVVFVKTVGSRDSAVRRRNLMVLLFSVTIAVANLLQVIWPLTPFTSLACLICNCFFNVFVIQDEQAARHMVKLEKALERARTAEKARSMFFSVVSHDIRTPLNAILGYAELLQKGVGPSEKDEALKSIHESGITLLELVNDVLDLAKIDTGKMVFHPEPVSLAVLTDNVFASFRMIAARKGIELVNRTAGVPAVLLDEHRFRQILFNLIGNAVKFTEHGSVTVAASYSDTNLEVSVSDTGCGIPADMLTKILDPFVQVQDPSHTADRSQGTGLGLSICRSLTEAMGGELTVKSEVGKGSTFRLLLPGITIEEEKEKSKPSTAPKTFSEAKNHPKHVLVVDDSKVNRSVLTAFLKKTGVAMIDQACDGEEALMKLDSAAEDGNPYDFVFSDLWMPNMNGMEFVGKLRADSRFTHLPVYALTADTEFQHDARNRLFTGTLLKPLTFEKLMDLFS